MTLRNLNNIIKMELFVVCILSWWRQAWKYARSIHQKIFDWKKLTTVNKYFAVK